MPLGSNDGHNRQRFCATLLCGLVAFTQLGMPVQQARAASYNADNQLTAWGSSSLGYDANGNLTSDGTNTYSWDARNQLSSVATRRTSSSFKYDAYGRRTQKTISGASTSYLYDAANPVQELSGTTPTANLLTGFGADQYLRRTDSSGSRDLLSDGQGSTVALTDSTGAVQTSYSYEPFGNTTSSGAASANSYQYTGRENDGSGLYYYRARYYSPGFQRFVSEDPAGFSGGSVDLYAYAADSPVNLTDPSGEFLPAMAVGCLGGATASALLDDVRMAMGVVKNGDPGMGAGQFAGDIVIGCVTGAILGPIFGKVAGAIIGKVLGTVAGPVIGAEGGGGASDLALGLTRSPATGEALLKPFAVSIGAKTWTDPAFSDIVAQRMSGASWESISQQVIDRAASSGGRLHFNLSELDPQGGGITAHELRYICNSASLAAATTFHGGAAPC